MKRKSIILAILLFSCTSSFAQLSIEDCYNKARANYPLIKQHDLIEKSKEYNLANANKGYLPQIMFSAKASYQSDVTEIPMSIPGFDGLSKDQYGATIDLNQTIWDGGIIKSKKEGILTASDIESKSLEVDLYAINDRVNQLYFGILLFDAQLEQNRLFQEELQRNYDQVSSYIQFGVAHQADLDAIKVEQLKAIQNESRLTHLKKAYVDMLSALIGETISSDESFVKPRPIVSSTASILRPELDLFDAQVKNQEAKNKEIKSGLMPKLSLYATGGYGRPGLDMLNDDFSAYYVGGIKLSWNLSNLYTNKNSKRLIQTNIKSIEAQRETFLLNTDLDISRKSSEIDNYYDQLKYDDDIIALRTSIKQSSESKVANGTLTVIDLMRDVNAEDLAMQDKILHDIELLLAMYNLKFATNN